MDQGVLLIAFGGVCFLPAVAYAIWLRNQERYEREPLRAVLGALAYGASLAILLDLLFVLVLQGTLASVGATLSAGVGIVAAPALEELAKATGLPFVRRQMGELEDGIVYGTALGLGFAATENLVYADDALRSHGAGLALTTVAVRSISSMLLHAATTALVGFGYGWARLTGRSPMAILPYLLAAIGLHAGYNLVVVLNPWWGLVGDVVLVGFLAVAFRTRLRQLDRMGAPASAVPQAHAERPDNS